MPRFISAFIVSFGGLGIIALILLYIAMIIGWCLNLYKLFVHIPTMDIELLIRLAGLVPIIGGVVGWIG